MKSYTLRPDTVTHTELECPISRYVDDWMFVKNDTMYDTIRTRLHDFRERTRKYWQYKDGSDRSTWYVNRLFRVVK